VHIDDDDDDDNNNNRRRFICTQQPICIILYNNNALVRSIRPGGFFSFECFKDVQQQQHGVITAITVSRETTTRPLPELKVTTKNEYFTGIGQRA
jgi:hypothetical protein